MKYLLCLSLIACGSGSSSTSLLDAASPTQEADTPDAISFTDSGVLQQDAAQELIQDVRSEAQPDDASPDAQEACDMHAPETVCNDSTIPKNVIICERCRWMCNPSLGWAQEPPALPECAQ